MKIISPLDKSVFKINNSIPVKHQKIKLNFSSNLVYDKVLWYIDNKVFNGEFLSLEDVGENAKIKVEVYKNGILVGTDEVRITKKN